MKWGETARQRDSSFHKLTRARTHVYILEKYCHTVTLSHPTSFPIYSVHLGTQFFLPLLALWRVAPEIAFANRQYNRQYNSLFSQTNWFFVCIFRFFFVPLRGNLHKCARTERYILFLGYSCCSCCLSGYGGRKWSPSPCPHPLRGRESWCLRWWLWIVFRLSYHSPRPLPLPRRRGGGVRTRPLWWLWIVFRLNRRRAPAGWRRPWSMWQKTR